MTRFEKEQRYIEIRAASDAPEGEMVIEGYAIIYDQPATHTYGRSKFTEVIQRGSLDMTDMKDVPLRYNHKDSVMIMARTRNGSLELIKDDTGLKIRSKLIDTQANRDAYKSIQEGLIDKMSFSFTVADKGDEWTYGETEVIRKVTKIDRLYDVSVVDTPFYDTTSVYARSFELLEDNLKQLEGLDLRKRKLMLQETYKN